MLLALSSSLLLAGCDKTPSSSETLPSSSDLSSSIISSENSSSSPASSSSEAPVTPDFDASSAPSTFKEMETYLQEKSLAAEAKFAQKGIRESVKDGEVLNATGYAYNNDSRLLETSTYKKGGQYTSPSDVEYTLEYRGLLKDGARYVEIKSENGRYTSAGYDVIALVNEETKVNNYIQISDTDAAAKVGSVGVVETVLSKYIQGSGFSWSTSSLSWTSRTLSEDKKSMTFYVEETNVSTYSASYIKSLSLTIDGNGTLLSTDFSYTYLLPEAVKDGEIVDRTKVDYVDYDRFVTVLGDKLDASENTLINPKQFLASSFEATPYFSKGNGPIAGTEIELGYEIKFVLTSYAPVTAVDSLHIVKSSDEGVIAMNEMNAWYGLRPGKATLTVSSVAGITQDFEITIVDAKPTRLDASLSSDVNYVGETYEINVKTSPEGALNDVTVTLEEGSSAATLTENEETGVWSVTPAEVGTVRLDIVSDVDSSVSTTLTFKATEKPTLESFKAALVGRWYKNSYSWSDYMQHYLGVEFAEDGTGKVYKQVTSKDDLFAGNSLTFHYTIDETAWTISFTLDSEYPSDFKTTYTAFSLNVASGVLSVSGSFEVEDSYGGSSNETFTNEEFTKE